MLSRGADTLSRTHRRELAAVAAIAVAGLIVRLWGLGREGLWIDELRVLLGQHGRPLIDEIRETFGPFDPPLGFLVVRGASHLPLPLEWAVRLPSALAGVGEIVGAYLVARALFERRRVALIAAALVALAPFAVRYSQEARYYTLFSCLHLLSWWALVGALRRGKPSGWVWVGLATALVYCHAFGWTVVAAQAAVVLVWYRRTTPIEPLRTWLVRVAVVVGAFVPWLAFEAWYWVPEVRAGRTIGFRPESAPSPVLDLDLLRRGAGWLLGNASPGQIWLLPILLLAVVAAPVLGDPHARRVALGVLAFVGMATIAVYLQAVVVRTYFAYRRVEFLTPVLLIVAAAGCVAAGERITARLGPRAGVLTTSGVVAIALIASGRASVTQLQADKTAYRAAAETAAASTAPVVIGAFNQSPGTEWDPVLRRYLERVGVDQPILSLEDLPGPLPPSGDLLWMAGSVPDDPRFTVVAGNIDQSRLETVAGDRSVGDPFVVPVYLLGSSYSSPADLAQQAAVLAAAPFFVTRI